MQQDQVVSCGDDTAGFVGIVEIPDDVTRRALAQLCDKPFSALYDVQRIRIVEDDQDDLDKRMANVRAELAYRSYRVASVYGTSPVFLRA